MTKIDIFSGFLGAGKTTLIKKLISEAYKGEKLVLIENEFGEIGVDGGFLKEAGIQINEMNSGCICCSLVGDFGRALKKVIAEYAPDRILIEPSGVGKLSDVIKAVENSEGDGAVINCATAVVDASKCKMYMKNFGEFFGDQIANAKTVILSRTSGMKEDKLAECVALVREKNPTAVIVTTPWESLDGSKILEAMETSPSLDSILAELREHIHDDDDDDDCCCGHHHNDDDDDDDDHEHEHHHHDHDDDDDDGDHDHEHHHEHGENCTCGCGGHGHDHDHDHDHDDHDDHDHEHHHHHHHADEVFESCGVETAKIFPREVIEKALAALGDTEKYGFILRAKGIVNGGDEWIHFDYTPGEVNVRTGAADVTGRICVIGSKIDKTAIFALFGI